MVVDAMLTAPGRRWSGGDQAWLLPNNRVEGERLLTALYDTCMFSLFDSRDASPAGFFDEILQALGRALKSLGEKDFNAVLSLLDIDRKVSSSSQNQALAALLFFLMLILGIPVGEPGEVIRAKKPIRLPRPKGRHSQTCELPRLPPLVRDPSHRKRLRHRDCPGASRPQRREDHHDPYACAQPRIFWSEEPEGPILRLKGLSGLRISCQL